MNLLSAKKTNMKMHKHTGDDRGTDLVFRMMLAEQAMLAGSQPIILQHHVLLAVAVIKKSPNAYSSLQQFCNNNFWIS